MFKRVSGIIPVKTGLIYQRRELQNLRNSSDRETTRRYLCPIPSDRCFQHQELASVFGGPGDVPLQGRVEYFGRHLAAILWCKPASISLASRST
jgi:hypothetical protein